jgi:hypothetical protein
MIEPGDCILDRVGRGHVRQSRPAQHDDLDAERSRRGNLAFGRFAAAVLGDDDFDAMLLQQRALVASLKGPRATM